MASYIGERRGSHGLFSDEGVEINLSKVSDEIDNLKGNMWGLIFSLKREDAERLGYNSAVQWMNLLRSRRNDIAKAMHISPGNLRWYAAYHNEETHPHVHMLVWSDRPQEPFLNVDGIHDIKQTIAGDIFRQEMYSVYKEQTQVRDDIKVQFRTRMADIVKNIQNGSYEITPELVMKFSLLNEKLSNHKGKKVYGYLDKSTKALVNDIVKIIGADKSIAELYDLWHKCRCETYRTYTDVMPDKIPIEDNEEFKSLRNQVVKTAAELGQISDQPRRDIDYDYSELKDEADNFEYLRRYALAMDKPMANYRLGRYYLEKTDDMSEAEYYLKRAGDQGNVLASYLVYKAYRDGKFTERSEDKMKYLRKAVDAGFGYAEYEYAKLIKDKSPETAMEYLKRASEHGSFQAKYMMGKMLLDEGKHDEAIRLLEESAEEDLWSKMQLGLLYCYTLGDWDKGMEHLHEAANDYDYAPAKEAVSAINRGLNAQIFIGVCDLFYYASNIIDERTEQDEQPVFDGMERRARRERLAKQNGWRMGGM